VREVLCDLLVVEGGPPFALKMRPSATTAATAAAAAAIASDPNAGDPIMNHVIAVVLRQPMDGHLAQALKREGISEIYDILSLSQADYVSLTFVDQDGVVNPLSICHQNLLKAVKFYNSFCNAQGRPIIDWTEVTKIEFDGFRCSTAYPNATESNIMPVPSAPRQDQLSGSRKGTNCKASMNTVLGDSKQWDSWHCSALAQGRVQDGCQSDSGPSDGEMALQHVLFEVLCQPWDGPLVQALDRSGFNEISDVLLLNQAERNALTFLNASNVITPLSYGEKRTLDAIKHFSCYCDNHGRPIIDWTQVKKADFKKFRSSMACQSIPLPSAHHAFSGLENLAFQKF